MFRMTTIAYSKSVGYSIGVL